MLFLEKKNIFCKSGGGAGRYFKLKKIGYLDNFSTNVRSLSAQKKVAHLLV
jgi:hypothetical protein